jgi:8-oxo-dGTP pyrophosphatase MutT (NUDIX family)
MPQRRERPSRPRTAQSGKAARGAATIRTIFEISAGGVVYRHGDDGVEVCLIATRGHTRWQLPKGRREKGEAIEHTAVREVAEETGCVATIGPRLDKLDLWYTWQENGTRVRHHKLVYLYLLRYVRGSTQDHDDEVDEARWFSAADALACLTFPSERRAVERGLALIAEDEPARTAATGAD